jgi:hypothetical protein
LNHNIFDFWRLYDIENIYKISKKYHKKIPKSGEGGFIFTLDWVPPDKEAYPVESTGSGWIFCIGSSDFFTHRAAAKIPIRTNKAIAKNEYMKSIYIGTDKVLQQKFVSDSSQWDLPT